MSPSRTTRALDFGKRRINSFVITSCGFREKSPWFSFQGFEYSLWPGSRDSHTSGSLIRNGRILAGGRQSQKRSVTVNPLEGRERIFSSFITSIVNVPWPIGVAIGQGTTRTTTMTAKTSLLKQVVNLPRTSVGQLSIRAVRPLRNIWCRNIRVSLEGSNQKIRFWFSSSRGGSPTGWEGPIYASGGTLCCCAKDADRETLLQQLKCEAKQNQTKQKNCIK